VHHGSGGTTGARRSSALATDRSGSVEQSVEGPLHLPELRLPLVRHVEDHLTVAIRTGALTSPASVDRGTPVGRIPPRNIPRTMFAIEMRSYCSLFL
jgi:hypothetical protein